MNVHKAGHDPETYTRLQKSKVEVISEHTDTAVLHVHGYRDRSRDIQYKVNKMIRIQQGTAITLHSITVLGDSLRFAVCMLMLAQCLR